MVADNLLRLATMEPSSLRLTVIFGRIEVTAYFPYLRGVAYADGEYAAVGDGGAILVSSNAVTWTQIPSVTSSSLRGIAGDSTWRADSVPQF